MKIELTDKDLRHIERMAGLRGWEITKYLKGKEVVPPKKPAAPKVTKKTTEY